MLGSSFSVSGPNIVLNTIIADKLCLFADKLEASKNFAVDLAILVKETYQMHRRIVFNGNNYSNEWLEEASRRGLLNLKSTVDALPTFIAQKNIDVCKKFKVFSNTEMHSRYEIVMENYSKTINIEALTMVDMVRRQILPEISRFTGDLAKSALDKHAVVPSLTLSYEKDLITCLSNLQDSLSVHVAELEKLVVEAKMIGDVTESARFYHAQIIPAMSNVRAVCDETELLVGEDYWPMPTYEQLLFSV